MIAETVGYLVESGRRVVYDAEHFFDGYGEDAEYALETLRAASRSGADVGRALRHERRHAAVGRSRSACARCGRASRAAVGIHAHDDVGCGVANTLAAVRGGATHVQGTINGYGERCGNANLCSIVPTLELKMGRRCLARRVRSPQLTHVARAGRRDRQPRARRARALRRPQRVRAQGRRARRGHPALPARLRAHRPRARGKRDARRRERALGARATSSPRPRSTTSRSTAGARGRGARGRQGARGARASRSRRPRRRWRSCMRRGRRATSARSSCSTTGSSWGSGARREPSSDAAIKIRVRGEIVHTAAEGNGPVSALDAALRKALAAAYPEVDAASASRTTRSASSTASRGRRPPFACTIDSARGEARWTTVGASSNVLEASWTALADGIEYGLVDGARRQPRPARP